MLCVTDGSTKVASAVDNSMLLEMLSTMRTDEASTLRFTDEPTGDVFAKEVSTFLALLKMLSDGSSTLYATDDSTVAIFTEVVSMLLEIMSAILSGGSSMLRKADESAVVVFTEGSTLETFATLHKGRSSVLRVTDDSITVVFTEDVSTLLGMISTITSCGSSTFKAIGVSARPLSELCTVGTVIGASFASKVCNGGVSERLVELLSIVPA